MDESHGLFERRHYYLDLVKTILDVLQPVI